MLSPPARERRGSDELGFDPKWKIQTANQCVERPRFVFWILLYLFGLAICWIEASWFPPTFFRVLWFPLVFISTFRSRILSSGAYAFVLSGMWCVLRLSSAGWGNFAVSQPMLETFWEAGTRLVASLFIVGIVYFYRLQIQHYQQLQRVDSLTGLSNSQSLYERVGSELQRCNRTNKSLTIALLDCDNFKRINDTYGHQCGDAALQDISTALSRQVRAYDLIARLGGDEFVILLPETDSTTAHTIIERLRSVLKNCKENERWKVTMSWGVVTCEPPIELTVSELIDVADQHMYAAKRLGNDNVCYHTIIPENETKQTVS